MTYFKRDSFAVPASLSNIVSSCNNFDCNAAVSNEDDDYTELGTVASSLAAPMSSARDSINGFELAAARNNQGRRKHQSLESAFEAEENDSTKRQLILHQRLEEYQSIGWLSQQEYRKYNSFLSTFDNTTKIGENGTYALKELEVELNLLENRMNDEKKPLWKKMLLTPTKNISNMFSKSPSNNNNHVNRRPLAAATNRFSLGGATSKNRFSKGGTAPRFSSSPRYLMSATILEPSQLSSTLSDDAISALFVETCFFSRLGFVQPPCCLQCTYRESMMNNENKPNLKCKRWVIWRRNANNPLHPSTLHNNTMAVQCQTARKLTAGQPVESYKWDRHSKLLLEPSYYNNKSRNW